MIKQVLARRCSKRIGFLAVFVALMPACAGMRSPVENSGPSLSREGVEVAVIRQSCTENVDSDFRDNDLVETIVAIEVHNGAPTALTVHRDAFRLVALDGARIPTLTWRSVDPLTVPAHGAETFDLRFMNRGSLTCVGEMRLDADAGLLVGDRAVQIGSIRVVPHRAL